MFLPFPSQNVPGAAAHRSPVPRRTRIISGGPQGQGALALVRLRRLRTHPLSIALRNAAATTWWRLQNPRAKALVMGDAFKRLVVRTLAQLLHEEFQSACALFQYALSTQAGAEALVRATCASTDRTTVLSVEGVGAYDHFSRQSMLSALVDRPALAGLLPYAALFYGSPSTYVFYDAEGHAHDVQRGEGGERGDPLMPSLFALGQHQALLETMQSSTSPVEHSLCVPRRYLRHGTP